MMTKQLDHQTECKDNTDGQHRKQKFLPSRFNYLARTIATSKYDHETERELCTCDLSNEHIFYCPPHHIAMKLTRELQGSLIQPIQTEKNKNKIKGDAMQHDITCARPEIAPSSRS
jgi:hypothetical protein